MTNEQKRKIETMRRDGKPFTEISQALGIPETTVKSYCYRKRDKQPSPTEQAHNDSEIHFDFSANQSGNCTLEEIRLIGAREAAKILGVNANTVYKLWANGHLDYWRISMTLKTNLKAISEFLERSRNKELEVQ